jgi:hypothetical protein
MTMIMNPSKFIVYVERVDRTFHCLSGSLAVVAEKLFLLTERKYMRTKPFFGALCDVTL